PDKNKWITTRKRSCAFVNTPSPCVNKTIHHIQELELKVEKFFQKYNLVILFEPHLWVLSFLPSLVLNSSRLMSLLSSHAGYDLLTNLKQETDALLLEVTELIKRLEADREEAEKALELEKERGKKLRMKIDCMSLWRLQQIPAAVQKEYDMCIQDTLELQWHLDCKRQQQRELENQILKTETGNREIQEDIDFMKKHSPLLEEKLILESEAVKEVLLAYEKVNTN
ncbi:CC178 protein, partial [Rostratula benghalensis]|nr:CC178 protein [Rostratula benghalensis]